MNEPVNGQQCLVNFADGSSKVLTASYAHRALEFIDEQGKTYGGWLSYGDVPSEPEPQPTLPLEEPTEETTEE